MTLSSLNWVNRFTDQTPGDEEIGGTPRQVPGACWSRVKPTPTPQPILRLWSAEMAEELGTEFGDDEILGGREVIEGMDPYAQRYGGHQFGNWAGQLGDGRAITLGEVGNDKAIWADCDREQAGSASSLQPGYTQRKATSTVSGAPTDGSLGTNDKH